MRRSTMVAAGALGVWVGATVFGCSQQATSTGFATGVSPKALPLGIFPASDVMTQKYGITDWRFFAGPTQMVVTGYRADGTPSRGVQFAWFKASSSTPGHTRLMMLDGSSAAIRRFVGGKTTGSFDPLQQEIVAYTLGDFKKAGLNGTIQTAGGAVKGGGVHVMVMPIALGGAEGGTTDSLVIQDAAGTGPQCQAAYNWGLWGDGIACGVGVGVLWGTGWSGIGGILGGAATVWGCGRWGQALSEAQSTCEAENAANCAATNVSNGYGYTTQYSNCNWDGGGCSGFYCGGPDSGSSTADAGASSNDDGGAAGDDGGAAGDDASPGDDGGTDDDASADDDAGNDDDAGVDDDAGADDDAGTNQTDDDAGTDDPGDDAGTDDQDPPTDQELDDSTKDGECPSCQGQGNDLDVNSQNGDVTVAGQDPNGNGSNGGNGNGNDPSTSASTDPGASGTPGGGSSGSGGGVVSGDDGTGQASEDQQPAQDQPAQDQPAQDQPAQDQPAQDQAAQDQPAQDQPAQDQPAQDASQDARKLRHHHAHKKSGWRRLYEKVSTWLASL